MKRSLLVLSAAAVWAITLSAAPVQKSDLTQDANLTKEQMQEIKPSENRVQEGQQH